MSSPYNSLWIGYLSEFFHCSLLDFFFQITRAAVQGSLQKENGPCCEIKGLFVVRWVLISFKLILDDSDGKKFPEDIIMLYQKFKRGMYSGETFWGDYSINLCCRKSYHTKMTCTSSKPYIQALRIQSFWQI